MKIEILHNFDKSFYHAIQQSLEWADTAYLGVAYASYRAFNLLKEQFNIFLRNNGKLRALFDIEEFITEKRLIEEFATIPGDSECKVFIKSENYSQKIKSSYHPKFYLFFDDVSYRVIIGSSNFTLGGIRDNLECNLSIQGNKDDLFIEFCNFFDELWSLPYSINILNHGDLLEDYELVYSKNAKAVETKNKKLQRLRKKVVYKADKIIQSKKEILNEDFAYLLGLISANSKISFKKSTLKIDLIRGLANRGKEYEGYYYNPDISDYKISQYEAHKKDVDRIYENLKLFFKSLNSEDRIIKKYVSGYHFQIEIEFDENSDIFGVIKTLDIPVKRNKVVPFVPRVILESNDRKTISSFIRGYCDLKARISVSDGIYNTVDGKKIYSLLRMGISIPHGESKFLNDFASLLKKINLEKGVNITDPSKRSRENLIRIDVRYVPHEIIGTHWRRIFLSDFVKYMQTKHTVQEY